MHNNVTIPRVPFYFVRHGETDYNKENKIMGTIDIPLNSMGLEQAHVVAKAIAHLEISHIVSSPLKRALQTAEVIAATIDKPITVVDKLTQNYLGIWEGRSKTELFNETGVDNLFEYWKNGGHLENAEPWPDFVSRVAAALSSVLTDNAHAKPILIVSHKPVYWAISHILNAHIVEVEAKNCGVYFFRPALDSDQWEVETL